jgi:hypothetical protein
MTIFSLGGVSSLVPTESAKLPRGFLGISRSEATGEVSRIQHLLLEVQSWPAEGCPDFDGSISPSLSLFGCHKPNGAGES